jgi:hypothetical protein
MGIGQEIYHTFTAGRTIIVSLDMRKILYLRMLHYMKGRKSYNTRIPLKHKSPDRDFEI